MKKGKPVKKEVPTPKKQKAIASKSKPEKFYTIKWPATSKKKPVTVNALAKELKSKSGHIKIWKNTKTGVYHWVVSGANGTITSSATGLNTLQGAMKGIRSVSKTLNDCLK